MSKRKQSDNEDSDSEEETKKAKEIKYPEGYVMTIDKKKFVVVSDFHGKTFVNIR